MYKTAEEPAVEPVRLPTGKRPERPGGVRDTKERARWLSGLLLLLIAGYQVYGRAFAYVGLIQQQVFIGEIVLAILILSRRSAVVERWVGWILTGHSLRRIGWAYLAFFLWGVFELQRGLFNGSHTTDVLKEFAFNYYPLYLVAGVWAGATHPRFLQTAIRISAWSVALYGIAFLAFFGRFQGLFIPGTLNVDLFGQPGTGVAILGLLAVSMKISDLVPLLMLTVVMLGTQVRAEWLGVTVALLTWAVLSKRLVRLLVWSALLGAVLWVLVITDFSVPAPTSRGGLISAKALASRLIAPVDESLASEYSTDAAYYAGTYSFRTRWWAEIRNSLQGSPTLLIEGYGYGYPLYQLMPFAAAHKETVRTPHSWVYYCLAYTGCGGLVLFIVFQATLGFALFRSGQRQKQYYGVLVWVFALSMGAFGNFYEAPFGAIPVYVMMGASLSSGGVRRLRTPSRLSDARLLS